MQLSCLNFQSINSLFISIPKQIFISFPVKNCLETTTCTIEISNTPLILHSQTILVKDNMEQAYQTGLEMRSAFQLTGLMYLPHLQILALIHLHQNS